MSRCRKCQPVPEEVRRLADLLERRWLLSVMFAAVSGAAPVNEVADAVQGKSPSWRRSWVTGAAEHDNAGLEAAGRPSRRKPEGRLPASGRVDERPVDGPRPFDLQ